MKKHALITGGWGFLGSHLAKRLEGLNWSVERYDYDFDHRMDVRDTPYLSQRLKGCELCVHMAAMNGSTKGFYDHPWDVLDVGVGGAMSVIEACQAVSVPDLIVMSSSEVYGSPAVIPTPETAPMMIADPTNPRFSYAASKVVTEIAALNAAGLRKVQVVRPFNIYGPGQGPGHVIPDLIAKVKAGGRLELQGLGLETRSFCHVDDLIDGMMLMYECGERGIYNIGNPHEIRIIDLLSTIVLVMEKAPGPVAMHDMPKGSAMRRCPDISKLKALGYEPKVSLVDGLKGLIR